MNMIDVLHYGHLLVTTAVDELPEAYWQVPGVCGVWSVKEIIAHLASFEVMLVEVTGRIVDGRATPALDRLVANHQKFNDDEVAAREHLSPREVLADYTEGYRQAMELAQRIPVDQRRVNDVVAGYGVEYDLEDFIVYTYYGHKREHCAQIDVYRDRLERAGEIRPRPASQA